MTTLSIWYTLIPFFLVISLFSFQTQPELDAHRHVFDVKGEPPALDVRGYVFDAKGEPLVGVHVYLAHTTFGTVTDTVGAFVLKDIPEGSYALIASMIGFETKKKDVSVRPDALVEIKVYLKDEIYTIPEITVVEKFPRRWQQDLKRFKRVFLGNRFESKGCDIVNPYVLDFEREKSTLYASAQEPLIIENKHLRYKITFNLSDFVIHGTEGGYRFLGYPYFEHLQVEDDLTWGEIVERRNTLYEGSMLHFFRSAAKGSTQKEGFKTYVADGAAWKTPRAMRLSKVHDEYRVFLDTLIFTGDQPGKLYMLMRSGEYLHVAYTKERMHSSYVIDKQIHEDYWKHPQISVLTRDEVLSELAHPYLKGDSTLVAFNEIGYLYDYYELGVYGYWSWESGICDAIPYNFRWGSDDPG